MAHIVSNPELDIEPDFASTTFKAIHNCIIGNLQLMHEEAANKLSNSWIQDCDIHLAAWMTQSNEEAQLAAEAAQAECDHAD
ncbi:hypothetical protein BDR06DRAFT_871548 [Suillus hirtellus]|nr:hypothetical protein BDR06DRAFT_871548 [Suillus hirtellus]